MLTVHTNGHGTVSPNYNGQLLDVGRSYSMTAKPVSGFGFAGWSGSLTSTNSTLTFMMEPSLALTANFVDMQKPTLSITSPSSGLQTSNASCTVTARPPTTWPWLEFIIN